MLHSRQQRFMIISCNVFVVKRDKKCKTLPLHFWQNNEIFAFIHLIEGDLLHEKMIFMHISATIATLLTGLVLANVLSSVRLLLKLNMLIMNLLNDVNVQLCVTLLDSDEYLMTK